MNRDEMIVRLMESKNTLRTTFGIQSLALYGSYTKNIASPASDVDLLFHLEAGVRMGLEKRIQLENYLSHLLGSGKIDLVNARYLNPVVRKEIEKSIIYI